jgi:cation:H+ antiporter
MLIITAGLLAGLLLLYVGAEGLVKGASSLALRAGITPLVVGLTVVAFGTSAPELVISLKAAYVRQSGIAVGNVVGSNIFNIAVILGLSALLRPIVVRMQLLFFDMPILILLSLSTLLLLQDDLLSRPEAGLLLAGIIVYVAVNVILARREKSREIANEFAEGTPHRSGRIGFDLLFVLGGLALLVLGARLFVWAAVDIARLWGASEAVIGLTIVAAGTSLPELATSVMAAVRKQDDIAIGNIVGSNVFNLLAILGAAGLVHPLDSSGLSLMDLGMMILTALVLLPMLRTRMTLGRWEGALLLALYGGYLWWLWPA